MMLDDGALTDAEVRIASGIAWALSVRPDVMFQFDMSDSQHVRIAPLVHALADVFRGS